MVVVVVVSGSCDGGGSLEYDSINHRNPAYGHSLGRGKWKFKVGMGR